MTNPPSKVLIEYLAVEGEVTRGGSAGLWPAFSGAMPADGGQTPLNQQTKADNAITIYDTAGAQDGRIMGTGEVIQRFGFQIRVRGADYPVGHKKAEELRLVLDEIKNAEVALGGKNYTISNAHRTSGVIPIGQEGESKRQLFTINGLLSLKEI